MSYPLALILADEFESRDLLWPLIRQCQENNLNVKVVAPQFLKRFLDEHSESQPIIFFADPSLRYQNPQEIFQFHQKSPDFPICFSATGEIVSFNPKRVKILDDSRILPENQLNCFTNIKVQRLLPAINPIAIIVRAHNRSLYFDLALKSLIFSLGSKIDQIYILLALSEPNQELETVAQKFIQKYPNSDAIKITPNSYLGTGKAALLWAQDNQKQLDKILLYEDDFILPAIVKDLYPNWPWTFSQRLEHFDLVAWTPSLENLPLAYHQIIPTIQKTVVTMDLHADRNYLPGNQWINSFDNYNLFTCGNAIGMSVRYYSLCSGNRKGLYAIDHDFNSLKLAVSTPKIHGFHIGWNQEQDGYGSLGTKRWKEPPDQVQIINLKNQITKEYSLFAQLN